MQKWGERIFSNRQLGMVGMGVYIRIVMIMVLKWQTIPHQKILLL